MTCAYLLPLLSHFFSTSKYVNLADNFSNCPVCEWMILATTLNFSNLLVSVIVSFSLFPFSYVLISHEVLASPSSLQFFLFVTFRQDKQSYEWTFIIFYKLINAFSLQVYKIYTFLHHLQLLLVFF